MRTTSLQLFLFSLVISTVFFAPVAVAQEYSSTGYYYNNFDDGQIGGGVSKIGTSEALKLSSTSADKLTTENGYSLISSGNDAPGSYQFAFLPSNTNLNNENFGWEWTFVYKNNENTANSTDVILSGQNAWKYWLLSSGNFANPNTGYYLTQDGSDLKFRWRYSNEPWENRFSELSSFDMSSLGTGWQNKTYAIRVQRIKRGTQFVWHLFVDEYTTANKEAKTQRGSAAYHNTLNTYTNANSGLHINSTTAGRFKFDEIKMYSMKFEIQGANDPAYGISGPLYNGQKDAVIYGLKIMTRGLFDINAIVLDMSVSDGSKGVGSILENARLFKSTDNYFGNADDAQVVGLNIDWRQIRAEGFAITRMFTVGSADGSMLPAAFYFIKADVKTDAPIGVAYSFTNLNKLGGEAAQVDYVAQPGVNGGGTTTSPSTSGSTKDWVGSTSANWNTNSNWSPNGVPGVNDLARIGVIAFTNTNQPTVNANTSVGNIIFGATQTTTLSVGAGITLTVNNTIEDTKGTIIAGTGTLTVKGTYQAKPTANDAIITATIPNFNASNFLLNTKDKAVTFNLNGNQTTVANSIQSSGVKAATLTLANTSTLTLNGANPLDFKATTNAVTLNTGSTVVYNANVPQAVNTLVPYKNIVFSGTGIKKIGGGTLTVLGNWTSSGGKVDLLANDTKLDFNGAAQSITDLGSDAGNGIVFKNVEFSSGGTKTLSATGKFAVGVGSYLTMSANTILQTGDNLTLKASALGSASVNAIPTNSSIQGQVRVEKYIQGGSKDMWRTNRMLSSPVYDNGESNNRTYSFLQFIDDMIITGKGGEANGFDMAGSASAWTYVSGKSFVEIPNINTSLKVGMGAYLFYRGDKTNPTAKVTSPFVDAESIVMDFKGTLNQQDISVPLAAANLVGNPYAATIDWNAVTKTETVSQVIRIWNPSNRQYSTFNGQDGVNGGNRYIGPGQAFFVQATGANASLTFTENSKISNFTQSKPLYNLIMSADRNSLSANFVDGTHSDFVEEQPFKIRAKLLRKNTENSDETLIVLKAGELATVNGYDVTRSGGEAVFLSSLSAEGKQMAINYMPNIAAVPSVKLGVTVDNSGDYELQITPQGLPVGYDIKLKDHYLNTLTLIDNEVMVYQFSVNKSDKASFGNGRFEIMLSPQTTLPVIISSFNAAKTNEGVSVKWTTSTSTNNSHFIVQRAGENNVYINISSLPAQQNGAYYILDKTPQIGNNYYRLVQVDKDGATTTNEPIVIKYEFSGAVASGILVYPTITTAKYTLKYNGVLSSPMYQLKISDVSGKNIFTKQLQKIAIIDGYQGVLSAVASGVYFIELIDIAKGKSLGVTKLIKN